ncbi:MAG: cytidyltransferase, partial [Clostridiales bacterium]|nr:cytidyltransferase [Clostridiales bacterium]
DMGFEVYLAVDEFSWSKQTLPTSLRRNIINMSIADELNIFLYPMDTPTNIANPVDLKLLRNSFPNSKLFMVAGSDVIINASCYQAARSENSIHTLPHIIFDRRNLNYRHEHDEFLNEALKKIEGEVIRLALPTQYEDISSTQIRNYIDENRDVTSLVDPLAQKYIYENSFYRREPQYKTLIEPISIEVEIIENITSDIIERVSLIFNKNFLNIYSKFKEFSSKNNARLILIKDALQGGKILGFSAFHWVRSNALYNDFKNSLVSEYIRENGVGRIILIDGVFIDRTCSLDNLEQLILTETLSFCLAKDYAYAVFQNIINSYNSKSLYELLELQGFIHLPYGKECNPIYVVNMNSPCTLYLDVKTMIKEPYRNSVNVQKAILKSRKRLQSALTKIYPGNLVLSFDRTMLHNTLIRKICEENGVSTLQTQPRNLGPAICVPFGNILRRHIVPNTITKALHTEKLFAPDMKSSKIGPFPYYMDLETQLKMIHSFNRPIILVDDLLHNGYRAKAIYPLLKREDIKVQKTIVGILSGKGKELMDIQNMEVESAYFIPKLRAWFNESSQYPFIGGDTLWRGIYPEKYLVPSINLILPYTSPTFLKNSSKSSIYNLSEVCIENSIAILTALEKEYQAVHERSLTLASLGDVFITPRYPDRGLDINYDFNLDTSHYLENDLEQLRRMEYIINRI